MKKGIIGVLLLFIHVLAIVINFNSLLQGSPANTLNSIASLCYFVFWIWFLSTVEQSGSYQEMNFILGFWGIVLITALLALSINMFDLDFPLVIPFAVLFLTPAYGIRIMQISNEAALTIIAVIALFFSIYCLLRKRKCKR